jgi:small subunit ribosomal protein S24e
MQGDIFFSGVACWRVGIFITKEWPSLFDLRRQLCTSNFAPISSISPSKTHHQITNNEKEGRSFGWYTFPAYSDILHPGRANISKEELREKVGTLYKAQKEQVQVFGLRTQFGGGKTTGFALVYDSPEALKKFEPQYRLIRIGLATKPERASRQQRKQRKNKQKTLRGTAKTKGAKAKKEK